MILQQTGRGFSLLLVLVLIVVSDSACPSGVQSFCKCVEQTEGFHVECQDVVGDLESVLHPFEKVHLANLRVSGAYWPVLKHFPKSSVQSLQLVGCGIERIEDSAFEAIADHIEELVFANNSLTAVPDLGELPKLLSLNLKYNKISGIKEGIFNKTKKLKHLRLEGNRICNLSRNALMEIKGVLELLDVSGNCLTQVPADNLRDSLNLIYLDLSENKITKIADFELTNLPRLKEFRLNDNDLSEIATLAFKDVPRLQQLLLQNNLLTEFDTSSMIEGFRQLEVLDISNNQLLKVPVLKELPNIKNVLLDSNRIARIGRYTFSGNPHLTMISLRGNEITTLSANGFNRLLALTHLLLTNNAIRDIDRGAFNGMMNLEELSLKNNSINEIKNDTFFGIRSLKMLDLSDNGIHRVSSLAFSRFEKLFWLDLSDNMIAKLDKGTFELPIPNIILYGNPLHCDEKIDWLVEYLVRNRVRTHLPYQADVMCITPEKYSTVKLKDFLVKKANETFGAWTNAFRMTTGDSPGKGILDGLIPAGMQKYIPTLTRAEANPYSNVPIVGGIAKTLPGLRHIPGMNYIPQATGARVDEVRSLNNAIEKFTSPLVRVATGESQSFADVDQMIQALPNLAANMPGFGNLDLSELPPEVLLHVLRGGQIPGVEKETLARILREHTLKMYNAAVAAKNGRPMTDEARYLPPLSKLPQEIVAEMIRGGDLPYLTKEQMAVIREYYTTKVAGSIKRGDAEGMLPEGMITPQMKAMIKMLPPGYDLNKIPPEVLTAVSEGKIPDLNSLPDDLQDYILNGGEKRRLALTKMTVGEVLRGIPATEEPPVFSSTPYDINKVSVDLIHAEKEAKRKERLQFYSVVMTCTVSAIAAVVVFLLFVQMKRKKAALLAKKMENSGLSSTGSSQQPIFPQSRPKSNLTAQRTSLSQLASHNRNPTGHCNVISPIH